MAGPPDITALIREQASAWSSVAPPNATAEKFAAALADTVSGFSALQGGLAFEQEPASFLTALQETKEVAS